MTAVILAAGLGTRLGASGDGAPKCLLRVGDTTLIERSVESLRRAGFREAVVVDGHRADEVEGVLSSVRGLSIRLVRNPLYATTGSMQSLLRAIEVLDDDLLVLESDLLYEERAIASLQDSGGDAMLVSAPLGAGDDVYVHADGTGTLRDLGKGAPRDGAVGALVGISRFSRAFASHLGRHARREYEAGLPLRHYEETILAAARDGFPVQCVVVPDLAWIEIDTPADLDRAVQTVWPEIRRRANGQR